jgi:hypothetical protein
LGKGISIYQNKRRYCERNQQHLYFITKDGTMGTEYAKRANRKKRILNKTDDRELQALEMRQAGHTYDSISNALGLANASSSRHIVERVMAKKVALTEEAAAKYRESEIQRLEVIQDDLTEGLEAHGADSSQGLKIVFAIIKVGERIAKIRGSDAATKTESTVNIGISHEEALDQLDSEYDGDVIDGTTNND